MGRFLQHRFHMETIALRALDQSAAGVHTCFQTVSPDVCEHRHRNRQRPKKPSYAMGTVAGKAVPPIVYRKTNARIAERELLFSRRSTGWLET
jgi:hypothetical protein